MAGTINREINVKDISCEIGYWVIKVKVIRLWGNHDMVHTDQLSALEMILMDSEGSKIQATISREVLASTCFHPIEGSFYKVGRVIVVKNDGVERVTDHPFRLLFWSKTVLKPWQPENFVCFGLTPIKATEISQTRKTSSHLIDVVGQLTSISSERQHLLDGRVVKMVLLELTDETGRVECAIYDEYVDQVRDFFKCIGERFAFTPVVIVQFARMMPFEGALFGETFIEVVPSVTNLILNPEMGEAYHLYQSFFNPGVEVFKPLNYFRRQRLDISVLENYLFNFPSKKIRELCMEDEVGMSVVFGTIIDIIQNDEWWESFVKYKGKATHHSNVSISDLTYPSVRRYNIKVEVFDGFESTCIALKDSDVEKLMKKSFKDLFPSIENPESSNLCDALEFIIGKKLLFRVEKRSSHQLFTHPTFKAISVCDDPEILRMFVTKQYHMLDTWTKARLITDLRRFSPSYDDDFLCHKLFSSSHDNIKGSVGDDCGEGSSYTPLGERTVARNLNQDFQGSVDMG